MNTLNYAAAFRNRHITLGELPVEILEQESSRILKEKHGFDVAYRIAVAGSASIAQSKLASAERLISKVGYLPINLVPEPENPYDDKAIRVDAPREFKLSEFKYFEKIGYIPRGICLDCGSAATAKAIKNAECFNCSSSNINPYFNASLFDDVSNGLYKGIVEWIGSRSAGHNIGIRIAIGKIDA